MVTVARPSDPGEQMLMEALLEGAGIAYFAKNSQVQNLFGAGQIGGFNLATGSVQIQVSSEDESRAMELFEQRLGEALPVDLSSEAGLADEEGWQGEPEQHEVLRSPQLDRYARYSKYSLGWAVMSLFGSLISLGGLTAVLAIFFGFRALRVQESFPKGTVSTAKPIFGIVVGLGFFFLWLWLYRQIALGR